MVPELARSGWVEWSSVKKRFNKRLYEIGVVASCLELFVRIISGQVLAPIGRILVSRTAKFLCP